MKKVSCILLATCFALCAGVAQAQELPAFPGAQGFGKFAKGVRGASAGARSVYHVTNLNDSGLGSLRDAVSQPNRIVVFDTCGIIRISSRMTFSSNSYIAGQTAPGDGIMIYGNGVSFSGANNLIVRHLRIYMGRGGTDGADAVTISNGRDMIFDHLSSAWGRDECFSVNWDSKGTEPGNITIQNCIIGQGLVPHSAGGLIQTDGGVSILGCFYIDNSTRNPKVKGLNQFINNVVYNWGGSDGYILGDSGGKSWAWLDGNYFIAGPSSSGGPFTRANTNFQLYHNGNFVDNNKDGSLNGSLAADAAYGNARFLASLSALEALSVPQPFIRLDTIYSAQDALANVIAQVGAMPHGRSAADDYMIDELLSYGTKGALITREQTNEINGVVGEVSKARKLTDTDGDGIPDAWETANGLNPNSASDALDVAANGYLNIENYVNNISGAVAPYVRAASNLKMTARTMSSLTVSWKNNAAESSGILLQWSADNSYSSSASLGAGVTSHTITGLSGETTYNIRLTTQHSTLPSSSPSEVLKVSTEGTPHAPYQSHTPVPAVGAASRFYTSVDFGWDNSTGPWAGGVTYDVYFGASAENLTKINAAPLSEMTFTYTPAAPLTMKGTYYWRVDATNSMGTTAGVVWSFKTGTYSFTTSYVDIGRDWVGYGGKGTSVNAQSGVLLSGSNNSTAGSYTVYGGTANEMKFSGGGGTVMSNSNNNVYGASAGTFISFYVNAAETRYVEGTLVTGSGAKNIYSVTVNGTSPNIDSIADYTTPVLLFSDEYPFNPNSVIYFEVFELAPCRYGRSSTTVTPAVPGAKSFRIYNKVTLAPIDEALYKVGSGAGSIVLGGGGAPRVAYVGATLELLSNDGDPDEPILSSNNRIRELTINGVPAAINNTSNTITCTLPFGTGAMRAFPVVFTLDHAGATADFTSGSAHNFTGDLSIEVTAEDESKRTYTVSATIAAKKRLAMLTVNGARESYDDLLVSAFDNFDITYLRAEDAAPQDIQAYYLPYDLIVLHSNVSGQNATAMATRSMVGVKPVLNLKAYFYNKGTGSNERWLWGNPNNAGVGQTTVSVPTELQNHHIFDGVEFDGESLTYYSAPTNAQNGIQYIEALDGSNFTPQLQAANHVLATFGEANGIQLHEVNLSVAAKYMMLGLSMEGTPSSYTLFNDNTVTLLRNIAAYLASPYVWYDYATNTQQGEEPDPDGPTTSVAKNEALSLWYANGTLYNPNAERLTVYALTGAAVLYGKGETTLSLDRLPLGLYIVKTQSGKVLKLVKQ